MKKVFLILIVFLLTGCSAEYNLTYKNDTLSESLRVTGLKNEVINNESLYELINNHYRNTNTFVDYRTQPGDMSESEALSLYEVYNKKLLDYNGLYGINLDYDFKLMNDYNYSAIVYSLFKNFYISESGIKATNPKDIFTSFNKLDKITITFKTDKEIIDTNCDEFKNDTYYWYLNKTNYLNKTININFRTESTDDRIIIDDKNISIFLIAIVIFILLLALFITNKIRKSNK